MKTNERKLRSYGRCMVRKLRVSALLLFLGMASLAGDRLIIEGKVNGNSVRLMFDTGSETSCLFRKAAQRLGISFTEPRKEQAQNRNGRVSIGWTEEVCLSLGDAEQKTRLGLVDDLLNLDIWADGVIAWADVTNDVILISANDMQVSVLDALPVNIEEWAKWRLRGDSRCLAVEVPVADGERKYVYIDTGMGDGVELGDKQWKRWRSENPNAPVTMRAYYTPSDGILVSEQCWARNFSLGNLSVPDTPIAPSAPGLAFAMKDHAAVLGLFALTRFDVILDNKSGFAYMKRKVNATSEFHYNKTGAVFAPTKINCDDLVAHVIKATPAYEAGVRNGDILLKIDDLDVTKWRTDPNVLPLSRFFARSAGTQLQLVLEKDGKPYTVKVILKDLFGPPCTPPYDSDLGKLLEYRAKAERGDAQAQYLLGSCYEEGRGTARDVSEAVKWWRRAAEQNHAQAQFNLGVCYENGQGVAKDAAEALNWYRKAADQNYPAAQHNLGNFYYEGKGVATNCMEAVGWWRKAAEQNNPVAQNNLGNSYCQGEGVVKNEIEAVTWYRKAADQGYAVAQYNLGKCCANGQGVTKDFGEAAKWYRKAAEQNYVMAQVNLGFCYENGKGVAQDYEEAVKWYRKAVRQNDALAQNHMGNCYSKGYGVAKDKVEAVKWYRKAADQNLDEAQFYLGNCYWQGQGVAKDEVEALKWWRKAAGQNHAVAQSNLGVCYRDGQGVAKDEVEAVKWFHKAAEQNLVQAQNNLGACYVSGLGVGKDKVEAYKWWLLADAQGDVPAKQNRMRLERQLTQEQQAEGRRRAGNFKPPEALFREAQRDEAIDSSAQNTDPVTAAEQALTKAEKSQEPDPSEISACLCRLGDAYAARGQLALSASLFRRALSIREKTLGPDRPEVAEVLEKLAAIYRKIGSWEKEADDMERRAAAIRSSHR